jgi:hypothetical protein
MFKNQNGKVPPQPPKKPEALIPNLNLMKDSYEKLEPFREAPQKEEQKINESSPESKEENKKNKEDVRNGKFKMIGSLMNIGNIGGKIQEFFDEFRAESLFSSHFRRDHRKESPKGKNIWVHSQKTQTIGCRNQPNRIISYFSLFYHFSQKKKAENRIREVLRRSSSPNHSSSPKISKKIKNH